MKEFDSLRDRYYDACGSRAIIESLKAEYLSSPIYQEISRLMASIPTILHLGQEKKAFLFQDRAQMCGQLVAVADEVSDEELRMITVILLEHAREYYDHQKFHQDVTELTGDILIQFAIRRFGIPVTAYLNLTQADIYNMGIRE